VYGVVPPPGVTVALPVDSPLHDTPVVCTADAVKSPGSVIVTIAVAVQEFASVTVTVYVAAAKPVFVAAVGLVPAPQAYVYGARPPVGATLAVPSVPPLQLTLVELVIVATTASGSWISILAKAVQLFMSVTVTDTVPPLKPVAVADVLPPADHA